MKIKDKVEMKYSMKSEMSMDRKAGMKKRGQEEIVGFVLIVVIVAVIFLVFLGISLRQKAPATQRESIDVSQFLASAMEYTTECVRPAESYYISLSELINECYSGSSCKSGESACGASNRILQEVIEANWKVGPDRPIKGYVFNSTYSSESIKINIIGISKGNCSANRIGAEYLSPAYPGSIRSSLEICS